MADFRPDLIVVIFNPKDIKADKEITPMPAGDAKKAKDYASAQAKSMGPDYQYKVFQLAENCDDWVLVP